MTEPVICPYCKKPMEDGYIASKSQIIWSWGAEINKKESFIIKETGMKKQKKNFYLKSFWCPRCRVIIIEEKGDISK
ncbi:MAG: PF20097 family protein [Promethearchaeota archaeon]